MSNTENTVDTLFNKVIKQKDNEIAKLRDLIEKHDIYHKSEIKRINKNIIIKDKINQELIEVNNTLVSGIRRLKNNYKTASQKKLIDFKDIIWINEVDALKPYYVYVDRDTYESFDPMYLQNIQFYNGYIDDQYIIGVSWSDYIKLCDKYKTFQ